MRRVEHGSLTDEQIEKIGSALTSLEDRMAELSDHFGLAPEDLNLDLGPLGPLLPDDWLAVGPAPVARVNRVTGTIAACRRR